MPKENIQSTGGFVEGGAVTAVPPRKWVALYKFLAARNTSHEML